VRVVKRDGDAFDGFLVGCAVPVFSRGDPCRQLFEFDWRGLAPEHVEHQPATFDCDQSFRGQ